MVTIHIYNFIVPVCKYFHRNRLPIQYIKFIMIVYFEMMACLIVLLKVSTIYKLWPLTLCRTNTYTNMCVQVVNTVLYRNTEYSCYWCDLRLINEIWENIQYLQYFVSKTRNIEQNVRYMRGKYGCNSCKLNKHWHLVSIYNCKRYNNRIATMYTFIQN